MIIKYTQAHYPLGIQGLLYTNIVSVYIFFPLFLFWTF
jgi:hypothetical protein